MFWLWEFQALNLVIKSLVMKLKPHLGTATTPVKEEKGKKKKKNKILASLKVFPHQHVF